MSHTALLYFVGPAGAGKSTLVASFQDWMTASGYEAVTVNLDPGAETVPYEVGIDVRERFTLASVMDEYSLGPNGAQIVCSDLLALEIDWLADQIKEIEKVKSKMRFSDKQITLINPKVGSTLILRRAFFTTILVFQ